MRNLKKLSLALMLTTLFSISFTSCIDTDVDPAVEAIYAAQADLIAAQTAVQNAEAGYLAAQAAAEQAQADLLAAQADRVSAITAGIEENNAFQAASNEQTLLLLVAQTNRDVAAAQNALALAQTQFEMDMAELIAELEAAGVQLATDYAYAYRYAMSAANDILEDRLDAEADLANAMLMVNTSEDVSWAYFLTQLQGEIDGYTAEKANLEAAIASLEAYMADPNTAEAEFSALQDQYDAIQALMEAKMIEGQLKFNEIMVIYDAHNAENDLVDRYEDALDDLEDMEDDKADVESDIADAQDDITGWQTDLADYAAALALLEGDVTAAEGVVTAAEGAVTAAEGVQTAAVADQTAANTAWTTADADLTTLEGVIASLEGSLQTAANNLNAAQILFDAGIGAATTLVTTTGTAVTTANSGVTTAIANYELWRDRFEGGTTVNGGYFWEDPTSPSIALGDDVLGPQTDDTGVAVASYVKIDGYTWNDDGDTIPNAADTYSPNSIEVAQQASLIAGDVLLASGTDLTFAQYILSDNVVPGGVRYFLEVGLDDVSYSNLTEMNLASTALGNEDIFDNPPVLGDVALVGTDAYTTLWNAQLDEINAIDALANFGNDLAAKQVIYDDLKAIYENELTLLDAAQALEASTAATLTAANDAVTAANTAVSDANDDLNDANGDLDDAELAVTNFMACDEVCIQANIDSANDDIADWNEILVAMQPVIDAKQAVVDSLLTEYEAAMEGYFSSLSPEDHAAIIALWQELWVMEQEYNDLEDQQDLVYNLIDLYDYLDYDDLSDLADALEGYQADLQDACDDLEMAQVALAEAQVQEAGEVAYIEYLQALIDTLNERYANAMAIADAWKALMDAAIGN